VEAFDKALLYSPTCILAMLHKADAWVSFAEQLQIEADKIDNFSKAKDLLEQEALALAPENSDLWAELARAYLGLDDLGKAEEASKKSLLIDKKHVKALNAAGLVKYYRDECVAAAQDFSTAIEIAPRDFQSYVNHGNALYGLRSFSLAAREYVRALELLPKTTIANTNSQRPYVLYLIARTQHERKPHEKAIETLNQALEIRTDFYDAQRLLAASYSGLEKWRAAEEALKAALKSVPPEDAEDVASTHAHLGEVYEIQGELHNAIAHYQIALATDKGNIEAKYGLIRLASHETGSPSEATP